MGGRDVHSGKDTSGDILQNPSFPGTKFPSDQLDFLVPKLPGPVHHILQLFENDEDQNGRGLQPDPGRYPTLEDEHRTLVAQRVLDHFQRRLRNGDHST